jgi:hypothetical protein
LQFRFAKLQKRCVSKENILLPQAAKFCIETALDSLILLRKINESSAVSNGYLARSAEKDFSHNPSLAVLH